jgi:D-beta-D-heptose 7-phosphate kinase/D-beta-D-heptose 1-phosphate adenosyltransferase
MAKNVERNVLALYKHCSLITNQGWKRVTKTRYVHQESNHTFIRIDNDPQMKRISVRDVPLADYDIVGISDYNKGFLTEEDISYLCAHHDQVFIDTKKILGPWVKNAKFIKINTLEYERSKHAITLALAKKIICTKGGSGAEYRGKLYPVERVDVKDLTGAGDSFFAALIVRYAETSDISEAIRFANECAQEVVMHRGVTVIQRPHTKKARAK